MFASAGADLAHLKLQNKDCGRLFASRLGELEVECEKKKSLCLFVSECTTLISSRLREQQRKGFDFCEARFSMLVEFADKNKKRGVKPLTTEFMEKKASAMLGFRGIAAFGFVFC